MVPYGTEKENMTQPPYWIISIDPAIGWPKFLEITSQSVSNTSIERIAPAITYIKRFIVSIAVKNVFISSSSNKPKKRKEGLLPSFLLKNYLKLFR